VSWAQVAVIVAPMVLSFLSASLAAILAYLSRQQVALNTGKITELHLAVNSRLTALLEATRASARAEGMVAGKSAEQAAQAVREHRADSLLPARPEPPPLTG